MHDVFGFVPALLAGVLLGAFFFGGLWWTVRKGVASENPALWFLGSLVLRTGVTVAGFYFVSQGDWLRLLTSLLGFLTARALVVKGLARVDQQTPWIEEAGHAPQSR